MGTNQQERLYKKDEEQKGDGPVLTSVILFLSWVLVVCFVVLMVSSRKTLKK